MINTTLISGVQPWLGRALPPVMGPFAAAADSAVLWRAGPRVLQSEPHAPRSRHRASVAMSRSPLTLVLLLLLLGGCAGKLAVETDPSPVRAQVGEDVVLKCQFSVARPPVDLSQLVVQWFHRGGQLVEFDEVMSASRPGAKLSVEGLRSGNAALYLSKVTPESAGNYRCYITYAPDVRIKQVVLHVEDPLKPPTEEPEAVAPDACDPDPLVLKKLDQVLSVLQEISHKLEPAGARAGGEV